MLWQRVLTAALGLPVFLALAYLGSWFLGLAVLALSLVGLTEWFRLAEGCGLHPRRWLGHAAAAVLVAIAAAVGQDRAAWGQLTLVAFALLTVLAMADQMASRAQPGAIANAGALLLGLLYLPFLFSFLIRIRLGWPYLVPLVRTDFAVPLGACWLVMLVLSCWASDTAAYFIGRAWGRRRLCPAISPAKTVEGSVAGLAAATVIAGGLGWCFGLPVGYGLGLGVLIGSVGQVGDLSKSIIKRQAGVKDSGAILPGHGGVIDRFDSLLFAAPVAALYLELLVPYFRL